SRPAARNRFCLDADRGVVLRERSVFYERSIGGADERRLRGPRPANARATLLGLPSPERFNEAARGSRIEGLAGAPERAALLHRDVRETEKQSTALLESDDFSATHLGEEGG